MSVPPTTGLEFFCSPGSGAQWSDITMGIGIETILNNYTFQTRYRSGYTTPAEGEEAEPIYAAFTLVSQSIAITSLSGAPTDRNPGTVTFFTAAAGVYDGATNTTPPPDTTGSFPVSGITDGSTYNYIKVFNNGRFSYIPRLSPADQEVVDTSGNFPTNNNDPANGIYPVNQVTEFAPDDRREITITFTVTTTYTVGLETFTDTDTIIQKCIQNLDNVGATLTAMLANSYYSHGIYGLDQWPTEEPALYNSDGTAIAPAPRPDYLIPDSTTSSGFAEYDQATNGEGFPLKLDTEPDVVPVQEEEFYTGEGGVEIPGVDYTNDTFDLDIIDASEYY